MLTNFLIIGLGSFIGGILRYATYLLFNNTNTTENTFPTATFIVNIVGSIILGLIYGFLDNEIVLSTEMKLFITIGICGGFTTFSAFALENFLLLKNGNYLMLFSYISLSLLLSIIGVFAGILLTKII